MHDKATPRPLPVDPWGHISSPKQPKIELLDTLKWQTLRNFPCRLSHGGSRPVLHSNGGQAHNDEIYSLIPFLFVPLPVVQ